MSAYEPPSRYELGQAVWVRWEDGYDYLAIVCGEKRGDHLFPVTFDDGTYAYVSRWDVVGIEGRDYAAEMRRAMA